MPNELILDSLEIRRFRGIRELRIGRLGRVNLLVGRNNVGKTTLLEALRLYARPGSLDDLLDLLASRDEIPATRFESWDRNRAHPLAVGRLFHGRQPILEEEGSISIGPVGSTDKTLKVSFELVTGYVRVTAALPYDIFDKQSEEVSKLLWKQQKCLSMRFGTSARFFEVERASLIAPPSMPDSIIPFPGLSGANPSAFRAIPFCFVGQNGLPAGEIAGLWDDVSLSPYEQQVIAALNIISPEIERVAFKEPDDRAKDDASHAASRTRIPYVKLANSEEPVPLRTLGDGVNRMFGIALALVNARGGFLLVDEFENGLHYSVQADLWRLVLATAPRLNVQVFATTHSYDCIRAFEEASRASEEDGVLIRLAQKAGRTLVGEFDENELGIAVEGQIEVR